VRVIDLVRELPRAEKYPTNAQFEVAEHTLSSVRHATIVVPAPSRMIWTLRLPARGLVRTWVAVEPHGDAVAASVTFRLGISDHRIYEPLAQRLLTASETHDKGWIALAADVSLYGGPQWSLFHRPDAHSWRLIFNADSGGGVARALWGAPGVDSDADAARIWWQRTSAPAQSRATGGGR
jgi:hypothetical protein